MASRNFVTHPIVVRELTVSAVADVTARMRRVTVTGAQLAPFHREGLDLPGFVSTGFDDHVKLVFAEQGDPRDMLPVQHAMSIDWSPVEHRALRDYTVRRATDTEVDLDFVRHGDGPAATWAENAKPGDTLFVVGPKSSIVLPDGIDRVVLVADETGLPAVGRFLDERPTPVPAQIVVGIDAPSAVQQLALGPDDTIAWVPTGELVDATMALPWPDDDVFVWAGAESAALLPLRRWLSRDKRVPKARVDITGYWHVTADDAPDGPESAGTPKLGSPIPWFAARAALRLGVLDAVATSPRSVARLADACGLDPQRLTVLTDALVSFGVLRTAASADGTGILSLAALGEEILGDEHLREELDGSAEAQAIVALIELDDIVRGRTDFATITGASIEQAASTDPDRYAERYDEAIGLDFIAPAVIPHLDAEKSIAVTGAGSAAVSRAVGDRAQVVVVESDAGIATLQSAITDTGRRFATQFEPADLVVAAGALAHRTDAEVLDLLARMADGSTRAWVIEQVAADAIYEDDGAEALITLAATGAPPRSATEIGRLAAITGWQVDRTVALGWGYELLALTR